MPRLFLRPEADADLAEAFRWYEERRRGLGYEFLRAARGALAAVERHPEQFPVAVDDIRKAPLRRCEGLPGAAGSGCPHQVRADDGGTTGGAMKGFKYELIVYWSAEDAVYVVDVPELPGCMAHGATPSEAVAQAQEAIALWVETAREVGREVPEPKGRRLLLA